MKEVYVIHEKDLDDGEIIIIGVASSLDKVQGMLDEYYGEHKEISYRDIRDSGLEYTKVIEVEYYCGSKNKYELAVEWFEIDSI